MTSLNKRMSWKILQRRKSKESKKSTEISKESHKEEEEFQDTKEEEEEEFHDTKEPETTDIKTTEDTIKIQDTPPEKTAIDPGTTDLNKLKSKAIEQDKQRYLDHQTSESRMSIILPALQNLNFTDDEEDEYYRSKEETKTSIDLVSEIEGLEVASAPRPDKKPFSSPFDSRASTEDDTLSTFSHGNSCRLSSETRRTSCSLSSVSSQQKLDHRLVAILPAVEVAVHQVMLEDQEKAKRSQEFEHSIEDPIDLDMFRDNQIRIPPIDPKNIVENILKPHEQEKADEPIREGMRLLFDNQFMKAKTLFQTQAHLDPLYALGLGSMGFIKAIMTYDPQDIEIAMKTLSTAVEVARIQISKSSYKQPIQHKVGRYLSTLLLSKTGLPANPPSSSMPQNAGGIASPNAFLPNGILRAHVAKAECSLMMGILQMTQENMVGYFKCSLNIRKAYYSYSVVWQEYKRMGQEYVKYMDQDTVSAIQFGIGAVHLLLSSMPPKILNVFSSLGWKSDKQLGFALLKLCLEGQGIRAPLASLTLLTYYTILMSFAPQLYVKDMMSPAIECLLDAQRKHPNSCFFLYFAARISRVAKNINLSNQSFQFAAESGRGEWAELAMKHMTDQELGFNSLIELDWTKAWFDRQTAFGMFMVGACQEMMGDRTDAILAFAEAARHPARTAPDQYAIKKIEFFQKSGYQDLDFSLPALEVVLVMNAFESMSESNLQIAYERVQKTLEMVYEREKMEYNIRLKELVPGSNPPDYYEQRAILLLTKATILNALGRPKEAIAHLNWIMDNKERIQIENWILPFTYWESGVTSWNLGNYQKSRQLWQSAMEYTKYDFEYRMAVRLSLALGKCDEKGITQLSLKQMKSSVSTHGRKRMPLIIS